MGTESLRDNVQQATVIRRGAYRLWLERPRYFLKELETLNSCLNGT